MSDPILNPDAIVGLSRGADGGLVVFDAKGNPMPASGPDELWKIATSLVQGTGAPALHSAPAGPTREERSFREAVHTLGGKLRETAAQHYGTATVEAAITVGTHVHDRVAKVGRRVSRRGTVAALKFQRAQERAEERRAKAAAEKAG